MDMTDRTRSTNPLLESHRLAEAEFQSYGDLEIVQTFGQPQAEYAAVRSRCAIMDQWQRAVVEVTGPDRLTFLNRLLTNQTFDSERKSPMPAGSGVYAYLLNSKGRVLAAMNVLETGERTLLELDRRAAPILVEALERYHFGENVQFAWRDGAWHRLGLLGPRSRQILERWTGAAPAASASLDNFPIRVQSADALAFVDDLCAAKAERGYGLIVPGAQAGAIWSDLLERFATGAGDGSEGERREVRPIGWAVFNTARIEAHRPLAGIDFDDTMLPAEIDELDRAVSFTKGCYVGQEVVARMRARGQAVRKLIGFRMTGGEMPVAGAPVLDDAGNQVGAVTSSTVSPILSMAAIGLALVKRPLFNEGTLLNIVAEGAVRGATVTTGRFM